MSGPYSFGTMRDPAELGGLCIFDDDGAETLVSWARGHGIPAAVELFARWLQEEIEDAAAQKDRARAVELRRSKFRLVADRGGDTEKS
ncbi:MAG: hypothetical protein PHO57_08460 [Acidithiobacillus sp.]|nr:hypothetical protein [Acidithiobacillus sp.]